jgi:hypothetical protein
LHLKKKIVIKRLWGATSAPFLIIVIGGRYGRSSPDQG